MNSRTLTKLTLSGILVALAATPALAQDKLDRTVLPIAEHRTVDFDLIIVATLDPSGQQQQALLDVGRRGTAAGRG